MCIIVSEWRVQGVRTVFHYCEKLCTGCTNCFSLLREALYRVYEPFFTTARGFVQGVRTVFHCCEKLCTGCTNRFSLLREALYRVYEPFFTTSRGFVQGVQAIPSFRVSKYRSSSTEPVPSRGFPPHEGGQYMRKSVSMPRIMVTVTQQSMIRLLFSPTKNRRQSISL